MRYKLTFILLFCNVLAFLAIHYWIDGTRLEPSASFNATGLDSSEILNIDRIEISGALLDGPRVLEKHNDSWSLLSPIDWPANYFAVQRILTQIQFLNVEARFTVQEILQSGQTLADYGLENPALVLTLFSDRDSTMLKVGAPTELGNRLYLLSSDEKEVMVVSKEFLDSLVVDLIDLRKPQILDVPLFEINALTVQVNKPSTLKVRVVKTDEQWKLEAPIEIVADSARVESLLAQLNGLFVHEFAPTDSSNLSLYGLADPFMRVTVQGGNRRQTLLLGSPVDKAATTPCYFAKLEGSPMVFTLCARVIEELKFTQELLRDRTILTLDPQKINTIEISQSGRSVMLQKMENQDWKVHAGGKDSSVENFDGDVEVIGTLIDAFNGLEAVRFANDAPSIEDLDRLGLQSPQREIVFDGSASKTIIFGGVDYSKKLLYVKRKDLPYVYEVSLSLLDKVPLNPLHYKDRVLEELPGSISILSLSLVDLEDDNKTLFKHEITQGLTWDDVLLKEPKELQASLKELLSSIRSFKVKDYLADTYTKSFVLDSDNEIQWKYFMEALVQSTGTDDKEPRSLKFYFSDRLGGTMQIGGTPTYNSVFSLTQSMIDALFTLTHRPVEDLETGNH